MSRKIVAVICALAVVLTMGVMAFASGEASGGASQTRGDVRDIAVPETAADWIMDAFSTKAFTDDPVDDAVVEAIVQAGINAPSAQNKQPCKFIVVKDEALKSALAKTPAVVIVAVPTESYTGGGDSQFAAGLAAEAMYLYAQAAGLGAHMYTAPVEMTINKSAESQAAYGIPEGYEAAVVIGFGYYEDYVDAASAATVRNEYESFVTVLD